LRLRRCPCCTAPRPAQEPDPISPRSARGLSSRPVRPARGVFNGRAAVTTPVPHRPYCRLGDGLCRCRRLLLLLADAAPGAALPDAQERHHPSPVSVVRPRLDRVSHTNRCKRLFSLVAYYASHSSCALLRAPGDPPSSCLTPPSDAQGLRLSRGQTSGLLTVGTTCSNLHPARLAPLCRMPPSMRVPAGPKQGP